MGASSYMCMQFLIKNVLCHGQVRSTECGVRCVTTDIEMMMLLANVGRRKEGAISSALFKFFYI